MTRSVRDLSVSLNANYDTIPFLGLEQCIQVVPIYYDPIKPWTAHSYAPRNTAPPADIHSVRGTTPAKRAFNPSWTYICRKRESKVGGASFYGSLRSNMTRVLRTSSGVVTAAAIPPAILPQTAASRAHNGFLVRLRDSGVLNRSYNGNCMEVKGISRITVIPNPL